MPERDSLELIRTELGPEEIQRRIERLPEYSQRETLVDFKFPGAGRPAMLRAIADFAETIEKLLDMGELSVTSSAIYRPATREEMEAAVLNNEFYSRR